MPILPRRSLADAVAAAAHAEHVTITATEQHVTIAGADMWLTTATQLGCSDPNPITATVPTRQLIAELKGLPDGDIEITTTQSALRLRGGKRSATIAQQGRLCEVRTVAAELWQPLSSNTLAAALKQVAAAAVKDEARPAVSGIRLTRDAVIATDGARLHHRNVGLSWLPRDLTLPIGCVGAVCDLLAVEAPKKSSKAGSAAPAAPDFAVAVGANNIAFRSTTAAQQRTLYVRLAPEPFVEWRRILDAAVINVTAVVDAAKLSTWLRSCPGSVVELSCGEADLRLRYEVLDDTGLRLLGEGEDAIEAEVLNAAVPIKLSVPYLRDALAGYAGTVRLCWTAGQPLRLSDGDWTAVLMFSR
ncbi:MAG: hypothetical protein E6Q97_35475 [Desulfurellales bacterium]|nr:MAG: hypothetical protein E6Q97_35475 [Desulfurellales bacterium]